MAPRRNRSPWTVLAVIGLVLILAGATVAAVVVGGPWIGLAMALLVGGVEVVAAAIDGARR